MISCHLIATYMLPSPLAVPNIYTGITANRMKKHYINQCWFGLKHDCLIFATHKATSVTFKQNIQL